MTLRLIILIHFLPLVASATSYNPEDLSDQEGREIFCSVLTNLQAKNGAGVWPGFNPLESPLIVRYRDKIIGYGNSDVFAGWQTLKTPKCSSHSAPSDFHAPDSAIVPYMDFNGTKAFFFDARIKSKLSSWVLSAIIHERFHRFQWEHFPNIFYLLNSTYTDHTSTDIVAGSMLENLRLSAFLKLNQENDWLDFISVALIREPLLSEASKRWELGQQIAEGTASFVQIKALEAVENEFKLNFRSTWDQRMLGNLDEAVGVDGLIKWRHYAVGGLIFDYLDRRQPDEGWKMKLQSENSNSVFRYALSLAGVDESTLKARGQAILGSSDGDLLRSKASRLISEYLADIKKAKDLLISNKLQVRITRPAKLCSGGGTSEKTYYLSEGGTLGLNYSGSFHCGSSYQDVFTSNPAVQESKGQAYFGLNSARIWLNSAEFEIHDGTYQFTSLKLEGDSFSMQTSLPGSLSISGTEISVVMTH